MGKLIEEEITLRKLEIFSAFMKNETIGKTAEALKMSNVSIHRSLHSLLERVVTFYHYQRQRNSIPESITSLRTYIVAFT